MNARFMNWWRMRSLREQRLLLAMGTLALVIFAWLLVVRPLTDALSEARERHGEAVAALAETRSLVAAMEGTDKGSTPTMAGTLDAVISQAASEAGFPVSRLDRHSANQVTLVIEAVRPQAFFAWVHRMEVERGLIVERLSATTNTDQTLAVQVGFRARSM